METRPSDVPLCTKKRLGQVGPGSDENHLSQTAKFFANACNEGSSPSAKYFMISARSCRIAVGLPPARISARQRAARFIPGVDAALQMTGGGEAHILRRLHRHGGAFAEGAIEQEALVGRRRQLVDHAAASDVFREVAIGRVQRARDDAVPGALAAF